MKRLAFIILLLVPTLAHGAVSQFNALSWCKADGTDQTANMQRAVNAAVTAGQPLYVPYGIKFTWGSLTNTTNLLMEDYSTNGMQRIRGTLAIDNGLADAVNTEELYLDGLRIYAGAIDVRSYGAVGDGSTDDTAAITNAISALPANGGTVYFPAGNYLISRTINITDNKDVTLRGESTVNSVQPLSGSIIQLADGADCHMLVKGTNGRVNIRGLVFDGNKANQTQTNLYGILLEGSQYYTRRCTIEDVVVWEISGTGIQNDSRESHLKDVHIGYCEGDGLNTSVSSDADYWNILSGFNDGNGMAVVGVPGTGAGGLVMTYGNLYRNGKNGLWLTNSQNSTFIHVVTDANVMNGILGEGPSWRNRFISCVPIVNNYYLDHDGNATTVPAGTYSNVKLAGNSAYLYDWDFIGCVFFQYESTEILNHGGITIGYQIEDARTAFAATKYARLSFNGCRFANGFCVTAPYEWPEMVDNASGEWMLDDVVTYSRNRTYNTLVTDDFRAKDQMEVAVGMLANAYYSGSWLYRSNGPAYYVKARYDDPMFAIQFAGTNTSDSALTWTNAIVVSSTNGYVGVNTITPQKRVDVNGGIKADDLEASGGLSLNAYYSGSWKRRADGHPVLIQPNVIGTTTNTVFYITEYGAADSAITWTPFLTAATDGAVTLSTNLTLLGTGVQVTFGATNTAPADPVTPTKWISVQVNGEATAYRIPLYE